MVIISCNLITPEKPVDKSHSDLISIEEGKSWFLRDISGTAENSILTYFTLDRSSTSSLNLQFEQYKASDEEASSIDFINRHYFIVDISPQGKDHSANITGIKTGRYDSYIHPGDADFIVMLRAAGLENFQLNFNEADSTIQILTDSNLSYSLYLQYKYEKTTLESLEHDGKIRDGEYTEIFYYSPMEDEFRLYAAYYFTYRNDEDGTTTLSNSFDAYGERIQNSRSFRCEITQFSNRAYPRAFYSETYISSKFEDFIASLGFFQFSEQSLSKGLTLLFHNLEAGDSSYTLQRFPMDSQ